MINKQARQIKQEIEQGRTGFLDLTTEIMKETSIIFSDNYGEEDTETSREIAKLVPFLELLHYGSKHNIGKVCNTGFKRVINHKGMLLCMTYYQGPETYVSVERIEEIPKGQKEVTLELLLERFREENQLKAELGKVVEKYIEDGLTNEEITKYFVDIMRSKQE